MPMKSNCYANEVSVGLFDGVREVLSFLSHLDGEIVCFVLNLYVFLSRYCYHGVKEKNRTISYGRYLYHLLTIFVCLLLFLENLLISVYYWRWYCYWYCCNYLLTVFEQENRVCVEFSLHIAWKQTVFQEFITYKFFISDM